MLQIEFWILCLTIVTVSYADLPNYITRCRLSDPFLNECLKDQANNAILHILNGDRDLGIPTLSAIKIPRILLEPTEEFTFDLKDCYGFGADNFIVRKLDMDTKRKSLVMVGDTKNPVWQCSYNATGKLQNNIFSDTGFVNITFTNCRIEYLADYQAIEIEKIPYYQIKNAALHFLSVNIIFSLFSHNDESQSFALSQILNNEYVSFSKEFIPSVKVISAHFFTRVINSVFQTVSVDQLFDP